MTSCHALVSFVVAALLTACASTPKPAAIIDVHHGVTVVDPYRSLEDLGEPTTREWYRQQGARAADVLARIPARDALFERMNELQRTTGPSYRQLLRMPSDRLWMLRRLPNEAQHRVVLRDAVGNETTVVDPDVVARATGRPQAIDWFRPSWDGRSIAYGISASGSEDSTMQVIDVATGQLLMAPIPRVRPGASWSPDDRTLVYTQLRSLPEDAPKTERYLDSTTFSIQPRSVGTRPSPLFGPLVNTNLELDRLDVATVIFAPGSPWMVARTTDTTVPEGRLFVAPLAGLEESRIGGAVPWKPLASAADRITEVALRGDALFVLTNLDAPGGKVLQIPLDDASLERARVVVEEPTDGALTGLRLESTTLLVGVRQGFTTQLVRHGPGLPPGGFMLAGDQLGSMFPLPSPVASPGCPWVIHFPWTAAPELLEICPEGTRQTGIVLGAVPAGTPELIAREVLVPSYDGIGVPVAVLHRKDLPRDVVHPTLLEGYGAYGISFEAGFNPLDLAWLERGGVLAYANVRGSGAFGDAWHRAGFKDTKANTWKDGIAAARWLIAEGYAAPTTLGILGVSAGGIFVGRAVTEAPDLFAAAVFDVGVLDTVRAETTANGVTNVSEFGSVRKADEFQHLLEMSTYHHVRDGTRYPAVLLVHGMNDSRVDVWHSGKTAARLHAASASGKPILLRLDQEAGHGLGGTSDQEAAKQADVYAFLLWQLIPKQSANSD